MSHSRCSVHPSMLFLWLVTCAFGVTSCGGDDDSGTINLQSSDGMNQAPEMVPSPNVGDANQSGVSQGATGATACAELLACASQCGDNSTCVDGCVARAGDATVAQLRIVFVCFAECDEVEDSDACGERNCVEPLIECFGGRQTSGETVMSLTTSLGGREFTRTDTWSDNSSGAVGFATETKTTITLCPNGQFALETDTQNFASGNIGDDNHSAMTEDGTRAQGQWQVYALGTAYVLELARTDGRTSLLSIAVQDGALYLDGEAYETVSATGCP